MKIQVKTLNQSKYDLEVDPSYTIEKLKDIIEEKYQHTKAHQVLIFSGRVLSNVMTVESCNVKENDFLVLMIKKPKGTPSNVPTQQPTSVPEPSRPSTSEPPTVVPTTQPPSSQSEQPSTTPQTIPSQDNKPETPSNADTSNLYSQSASTLVTGPELQAVADNIASMGFPKEQVLLALRASFGNPDRALEYLLNGIPDVVQPQQQQQPPQGQPQARVPTQPRTAGTPATTGGVRLPTNILPPGAAGSGASPYSTGGVPLPLNLIPPSLLSQQAPHHPSGVAAPGAGGAGGAGAGGAGRGSGGGGVFDFLRNHPAFPQLRHIARTDPQRLQEIITQLVQTTPHLLPLITQHQDEFIELLREGGGGGGGGVQIQVTPQDQEAINHLMSLGFTRERAAEAYFLFEKDENLAANYLLSYGNDDEEIDFVDDEADLPDE